MITNNQSAAPAEFPHKLIWDTTKSQT